MSAYAKALVPLATGLVGAVVLFAFGLNDAGLSVLGSTLALAGLAWRVPNRT